MKNEKRSIQHIPRTNDDLLLRFCLIYLTAMAELYPSRNESANRICAGKNAAHSRIAQDNEIAAVFVWQVKGLKHFKEATEYEKVQMVIEYLLL